MAEVAWLLDESSQSIVRVYDRGIQMKKSAGSFDALILSDKLRCDKF